MLLKRKTILTVLITVFSSFENLASVNTFAEMIEKCLNKTIFCHAKLQGNVLIFLQVDSVGKLLEKSIKTGRTLATGSAF